MRKIDLSEIPAAKRSAQGKLLVQPAQGDSIVTLLHLPSQRSGGSRSEGSVDKKRRSAEPAVQPAAQKRSPEFEFEEASLFDMIDETDLPVKAERQAKPEKLGRAQGKLVEGGSQAATAQATPAVQPKPAVLVKQDARTKPTAESAGLGKVSVPSGTVDSSGARSRANASRSNTASQAGLPAAAPPSQGQTAGDTAPVKKAEVKLAKATPTGVSSAGKPAVSAGKAPAPVSTGGKAAKPETLQRGSGSSAAKDETGSSKSAGSAGGNKASARSSKACSKGSAANR